MRFLLALNIAGFLGRVKIFSGKRFSLVKLGSWIRVVDNRFHY